MLNQRKKNIKTMLQPRHIVFVGSKGLIEQGVENCKRIGYDGEILAIHRMEKSISGVTCYPTVAELPYVPDVAFVAVRADIAVQIIEELRNLGVAGVVCYAAGFSEIGNQELNKQLVKA